MSFVNTSIFCNVSSENLLVAMAAYISFSSIHHIIQVSQVQNKRPASDQWPSVAKAIVATLQPARQMTDKVSPSPFLGSAKIRIINETPSLFQIIFTHAACLYLSIGIWWLMPWWQQQLLQYSKLSQVTFIERGMLSARFDASLQPEHSHFRQVDTVPYAKEGRMEELIEKEFGI